MRLFDDALRHLAKEVDGMSWRLVTGDSSCRQNADRLLTLVFELNPVREAFVT